MSLPSGLEKAFLFSKLCTFGSQYKKERFKMSSFLAMTNEQTNPIIRSRKQRLQSHLGIPRGIVQRHCRFENPK
jgi:hypothetical protein